MTSLTQVLKAVTDHIDHPNLDYSLRAGQSFLRFLSSFLNFFVRYLEIGKEYQGNRAEFNRIAMEYVTKHGLPR